MSVFGYISSIIVPILFFIIIMAGIFQKVPVFDTFVEGAKSGTETVVKIFPTLTGLMMAVGILRTSGFFEWFGGHLGELFSHIGIPDSVIPVVIVKMFSSSAASALVLDIYKQFGVDSLEGLMSSLIIASTESIFYCMSIYYTSVKITKTRWTLKGALFATFFGIMTSVLLCLS